MNVVTHCTLSEEPFCLPVYYIKQLSRFTYSNGIHDVHLRAIDLLKNVLLSFNFICFIFVLSSIFPQESEKCFSSMIIPSFESRETGKEIDLPNRTKRNEAKRSIEKYLK